MKLDFFFPHASYVVHGEFILFWYNIKVLLAFPQDELQK